MKSNIERERFGFKGAGSVLKERKLALREREAKIRVMELTNLEKERELKNKLDN
jgi:hypothetical protein